MNIGNEIKAKLVKIIRCLENTALCSDMNTQCLFNKMLKNNYSKINEIKEKLKMIL